MRLKFKQFSYVFALVVLGLATALPAGALTNPDKYVRVANYYLVSNIPRQDWDKLAKYDLVIFPMEAQYYDPEFRAYAKAKNPDIIILAYVPSQSINVEYIDDPSGIRQRLKAGIREEWYLTDSSGNRLSTWPGIWNTNLATPWNVYLAEFVAKQVISTGFWDGVMYDMVWENVDWVNNGDVDVNRDGQKDDGAAANELWRAGMTELLKETRQHLGSEAIIITNGSSLASYQPYVNGRMFESFPTPWEGNGRWQDSMRPYLTLGELNIKPVTHVINGNTRDTGDYQNYHDFRFSLTSALMGDGYFSYDFGVTSHSQLWWYDEYDTVLGRPVGVPVSANPDFSASFTPANPSPGFWRRDFQNGLALVNATAQTQTIIFNEEFEKIHGQQDQNVNNGAIISEVTVPPNDGLVLLRPLNEINGDVYDNGSFARVFNNDGVTKRTGFFAYNSQFRGGVKVIRKDLDRDGNDEFVAADGNHVDIYNGQGERLRRFYPYGEQFAYGVNLAIGDVDRDNLDEIVTGTADGGGPLIKIFNHLGETENDGWFAYAPGFKGGVNVGVGDLNGDGWHEIIAGAGVGGGPHIRVFNGQGKLINPGFFAYDPKFRGGVRVAVGDFNGDAIAEIAAAPGPGGGPHLRVFNRDGKLINPGWFAYSEKNRQGINVIANDLDGDGIDEIIATTADVFTITSLRLTEEIATKTKVAIDGYLESLNPPAASKPNTDDVSGQPPFNREPEQES